MTLFPIENLVPKAAVLTGERGKASLTVALLPFDIPNFETVETELRADCISLPTVDLTQLDGRAFTFAINPAPGYIDGSIYIDGAHHPVDISRIAFNTRQDGIHTATIEAKVMLSFEGLADFDDADWQFTTPIVRDA